MKVFVVMFLSLASTLSFADHDFGVNRGDKFYCEAGIETVRGKIVDYFSDGHWNREGACNGALTSCERELYKRQRNGRNPRAVCVVLNDGRNPKYRGKRRSCTYRLVDYGYYSHTVDHITRWASGYSRSEAKQRACRKARKACERRAYRSQSCVRD